MTQKKTADGSVAAKPGADIPAQLPLELIPVYLWWKANGNQLLMNVAVALVAGGVVFGVLEWRRGRAADADREFAQAGSLDELQAVVDRYGSMKVGGAARLRLAKAYFDAEDYEAAVQTYEACLRKGEPAGFEGFARLGLAHALEAMGSLDEAAAAYGKFAGECPGHFLAPQAQMGMARVLALQGRKDEARNLLELLKAERTGEPMVEMAVAQLTGVIDRYEPRRVRSLFDRADEAARGLPVPVAPVVAPAAGAEDTPD